jgi:hypothetical protein
MLGILLPVLHCRRAFSAARASWPRPSVNSEGIDNPFNSPASNEELEHRSIQAQIDHEAAVHARQLELRRPIRAQQLSFAAAAEEHRIEEFRSRCTCSKSKSVPSWDRGQLWCVSYSLT